MSKPHEKSWRTWDTPEQSVCECVIGTWPTRKVAIRSRAPATPCGMVTGAQEWSHNGVVMLGERGGIAHAAAHARRRGGGAPVACPARARGREGGALLAVGVLFQRRQSITGAQIGGWAGPRACVPACSRPVGITNASSISHPLYGIGNARRTPTVGGFNTAFLRIVRQLFLPNTETTSVLVVSDLNCRGSNVGSLRSSRRDCRADGGGAHSRRCCWVGGGLMVGSTVVVGSTTGQAHRENGISFSISI